MERLVPIPRDAPIGLTLPEPGASDQSIPASLLDSHNALLKALAEGDLTPHEAQVVSALLEAKRRSWEAHELHQRLEKIEEQIAEAREREQRKR
jgi:hypothetical protein